METMIVIKISTLVLAMYFQVVWLYEVSLPSRGGRNNYQWSKFPNFFVSDRFDRTFRFSESENVEKQ